MNIRSFLKGDAPFVISKGSFFSRNDIRVATTKRCDALHREGASAAKIITVKSTGLEAIIDLLAAWSMDKPVWLCPLREPGEKLAQIGRLIEASWDQDDGPSTAINSSGSTGFPKCVVHRLDQHLASAQGVNAHMEFDASGTWLLSLPLYHVGGLAILMRALIANAAIILPGHGERVEDVLLCEEPSHVSLVEAQLGKLVSKPETLAKLRRCRRIVMGGGPLSPSFAKDDLPIVASYGATEMASMWTATKLGEGFASQGSGTVLAGRELKVSSEGELLARGPLLGHYLGKTLCDAEGYYHTGDLGYCDAQGHWHIVGRKDNMFISGGENIHPEEIEHALRNHPSIQNAVVIGVPDAHWGERPVAFVESNEVIGEQALRAYLAELLPRFKIPDRFVPWCHTAQDGLKPKRAQLRQKYLSNF